MARRLPSFKKMNYSLLRSAASCRTAEDLKNTQGQQQHLTWPDCGTIRCTQDPLGLSHPTPVSCLPSFTPAATHGASTRRRRSRGGIGLDAARQHQLESVPGAVIPQSEMLKRATFKLSQPWNGAATCSWTSNVGGLCGLLSSVCLR